MNLVWEQSTHSPLLSVSCQVQFPMIVKISRELPASFQEQLRKDYPLFQPTQDRRGYRLDSQDNDREIILLPDSLTVMTTRYTGWPAFQAQLSEAVRVLQASYEPAFCTRINLRFQNLLRPILYGFTKIQWAALIDAKVLGPFGIPGHKGHLQGSRHEVVVTLPDGSDRFRLTHGFVQYREANQTNQPGTPAYLLDQDYFTTQRVEWDMLMPTLERFELDAGQFFRLCVTDQFHQAMVDKAA